MRHSEQLPLTPPWIGRVHAAEVTATSALLDHEPRIAALAGYHGAGVPTHRAPSADA